MSLKIFIGKNKTGKSHKIRELYKKEISDNKKAILIPSEFDLDDYLEKANAGTSKAPLITPQATLLNFIYNSFLKNVQIKIENYDDEILNFNKEIKNFKSNLKNKLEKDNMFEGKIIDNIKEIEINKDNKKENDLKKYLLENDNIWEKYKSFSTSDFSSGTKIYSLFKMLFEIIENNFSANSNSFIKDLTIFFDEPENHCHPELINKFTSLFINLSKKINLVISTHSSFLLQKIFYFLEKEEKNDFKIDFFYKEENNFKCKSIKLDLKKYKKISKHIPIVLFSSNLFLCEGVTDYNFIYSILKEKSEYYSIVFSEGKKNLETIVDFIIENQINKQINCTVMYDYDKKDDPITKKFINLDNNQEKISNEEEYDEKKIEEINFIYLEPNIEEYFFEVSNNQNEPPINYINYKIKNHKKNLNKSSIKEKLTYDDILKFSTFEDIGKKMELVKNKLFKGLKNE